MNAPLYNALIEYSKNKYPFHMPGHKLGRFGDLEELNLFKLDVTEANGLDNLYEAEGIIEAAMKELARFYGAKDTLMLTNGSTAGILAGILSLCKPGEEIIVARNCHHSVWHAMILAGVKPVYVMPRYDEDTGLMMEMTPATIKQAVQDNPDIKGAIIVSPTYEGVVSEVKEIGEVLHVRDKWLMVDEAHGAHFILSDYFPQSSLAEGADLVIHSMHKTLPTLTQSGLIHMNSERVSKEKLIKALRMVQTSSPSYAMMGLMDYMRAYIEESKEVIEQSYILPLKNIRKALRGMKVLQVLDEVKAYDASKLVVLTHKSEIDGYTLSSYLEEGHHIMCEAALPQGVILMSTIADDQHTLNRLENALSTLDEKLYKRESHITIQHQGLDQVNHQGTHEVRHEVNEVGIDLNNLYTSKTFAPREIYYEEALALEVEKVEGYISKENIMLYPPGIPIVCVGEVLTKQHIDMIKKWHHKLKGIQHCADKIICKVVGLPIQ